MTTNKEKFYEDFSDFLHKHYTEDKIKEILDDEIIEQFDIDTLKNIFVGMDRLYYKNKFYKNFETVKIDFKKVYRVLEIMNKVLQNYTLDNQALIYNTLGNFNDDHLNVIYSLYDNYMNPENIEKIEKGTIPEPFQYLLNYLLDRDILNLNVEQIKEPEKTVYLKDIKQVILMYQEKKNKYLNYLVNLNPQNFSLVEFKEAYLYLNYGLTLEQAEYIRTYQGQFLDYLSECIDENDHNLFETLKAICFICKHLDFSEEDIKDMSSTTIFNLKNMQNHNCLPAVILSDYFKQMYLNAYNKKLFKITNINNLPKKEGLTLSYVKDINGVPILDSGVDFLMVVHSIERVSLVCGFSDDVDDNRLRFSSKFNEDWKKSYNELKKGFSTSIIGSTNMGTLCNDNYLLGFSSFDDQRLITMSQGDAYTSRESATLHRNDLTQERVTNYFIPPNKIEDESRYGYNEAFFSDSKEPDYLVAFSKAELMDESYPVVSAAKSLGCPLVCIDIEKVQQHEIDKIKAMETALFSDNNLNPTLISSILCRYMNLYTSTISGTKKTLYDIISEIRNFIFNINDKVNWINDLNVRLMWLDELTKAYQDELRKYVVAGSIRPYSNSVKTFILNDDKYLNIPNFISIKKAEIFSAMNNSAKKR